jgi:multicomponent Na+:H+ antiporter subunit G
MVSTIVTVLSIVLIVAGVFFLSAGTIGFLRFPDFYSRMHAVGKCDTLGTTLTLAGLALYNLHDGLTLGSILVSLKIMLIAVFWFLGNPTATHALSKATFQSGKMPWTKNGKTVIEWPPEQGG